MISPRTIRKRESGGVPPSRVWYTSYGSNMDLGRLSRYIVGGRPPGAARGCPGCRDRRLPEVSVPVELDGTVYFATESPVWTGGRAFYDPDAPGRVFARAHLVSVEQFSDIAAQEMYRRPGADLDLSEVLSRGRAELGTGRYETLVCPGTIDGLPVLTFTAPWGVHDLSWNRPSAPYVRLLARGLPGTCRPSRAMSPRVPARRAGGPPVRSPNSSWNDPEGCAHVGLSAGRATTSTVPQGSGERTALRVHP